MANQTNCRSLTRQFNCWLTIVLAVLANNSLTTKLYIITIYFLNVIKIKHTQKNIYFSFKIEVLKKAQLVVCGFTSDYTFWTVVESVDF